MRFTKPDTGSGRQAFYLSGRARGVEDRFAESLPGRKAGTRPEFFMSKQKSEYKWCRSCNQMMMHWIAPTYRICGACEMISRS